MSKGAKIVSPVHVAIPPAVEAIGRSDLAHSCCHRQQVAPKLGPRDALFLKLVVIHGMVEDDVGSFAGHDRKELVFGAQGREQTRR